jgi:hypothetical protein
MAGTRRSGFITCAPRGGEEANEAWQAGGSLGEVTAALASELPLTAGVCELWVDATVFRDVRRPPPCQCNKLQLHFLILHKVQHDIQLICVARQPSKLGSPAYWAGEPSQSLLASFAAPGVFAHSSSRLSLGRSVIATWLAGCVVGAQ